MTVVVNDTEYKKIQELLDEIKNGRIREIELERLESQALEKEQLEEYYKLKHDLHECRGKISFAEHCLSLKIGLIF